MKFKKIVVGLCVAAVSSTAVAQINITSTTPKGYLSRGVQMYGMRNYDGAIDQLTHLRNLLVSASDIEEADYYIAKSYFQKGNEKKTIELLNRFLSDYPLSFRNPDVYATLGDACFYNGNYARAIPFYLNVNRSALPVFQQEDVIYRLAFSELKVKEGDEVEGKTLTEEDVERYRRHAEMMFDLLDGTERYADASKFYKAYISYEKNDYDTALQEFLRVDRRSELGHKAQYYLCHIYYVKEEPEKVVSIGTKLLSGDNSSAMDGEVSRIVGESYYRNGDDDKAGEYINKYLELVEGEPSVTAQYILGTLDYRNAEYQSAIEHLGSVAQEENAMGQSAYYYLGQAYRKSGNMPLAAMAFEKAAQQSYSPTTQESAFYNYAVIQNEGGRTPFSKAIEMFEGFLTKFPNSKYADEVGEYMVSAYMTGNDYQKALSSISRIKEPNAKVLKAKQTVLYNLGVESLSNDKVVEAEDYFLKARQLASCDADLDAQVCLWLGECAYRNGDYERAVSYQNEFLRSSYEGENNYGLGYYNLGYSRFQQKKYDEARAAFRKAIASNSLSEALVSDANNRIGDTYYYSRKYDTAENYYEKATGDYAIYQKGIMLGLDKDYKGKIAQMNELLKLYPSSSLAPSAMLEQADAYMSMNNSRKAIAVYDELIKAYPEDAIVRKAMLNKAITERNSKNEASAIEAYKAVITKYPTSEEASVAVEDLKLIYADKGQLKKLNAFIQSVKNAPKLDVNDIDRLTFEAAEKSYMADNSSISKMKSYLASYPNGAYAANAKYYVAKYNYNKGNNNEALSAINSLEKTNADASFMEDALAIKGSILVKQGKNKEALATYRKLVAKATNADNRLTAQLGVMRVSVKLDDNKSVIESADKLLKVGGLTAEEEKEVTFSRAEAYYKSGSDKEAASDFATLSQDTRNLYGAKSAYYLAEMQYNDGKLKDAENTLNRFIDEGTPHQYWLARGFILLADVYHKQGKNFEACEYLESLKNNYPGEETDIFNQIEERLTEWKSASKKTSKK